MAEAGLEPMSLPSPRLISNKGAIPSSGIQWIFNSHFQTVRRAAYDCRMSPTECRLTWATLWMGDLQGAPRLSSKTEAVRWATHSEKPPFTCHKRGPGTPHECRCVSQISVWYTHFLSSFNWTVYSFSLPVLRSERHKYLVGSTAGKAEFHW